MTTPRAAREHREHGVTSRWEPAEKFTVEPGNSASAFDVGAEGPVRGAVFDLQPASVALHLNVEAGDARTDRNRLPMERRGSATGGKKKEEARVMIPEQTEAGLPKTASKLPLLPIIELALVLAAAHLCGRRILRAPEGA